MRRFKQPPHFNYFSIISDNNFSSSDNGSQRSAFDDKNQKALGAILHGAYTNLQKSEMQIILFDDEDASSLGLTPDHSINLLGEDKSGFNPFYMPSKEDSPNAPEEVE